MNTYRLSIRAYADGFSFSVVNLLDGNLMRQEEVPVAEGTDAVAALNDAFARPRLTSYDSTEVELLADSPATIVPLDAFRRDDVQSLYRLNFPSTEVRKDEVQYEMLPSLEVVVIYALSANVLTAVRNRYPEATIRSTLSQTLEEALALHRKAHTNGKDFYAYIHRGQMTLCVMLKNKLHFACTYEACTDADRLYHLLAVWKAMDMNAENDICHVAGAEEGMMDSIARYIRKVESCE